MRRFEAIIMSEVEPSSSGSLWLKEKRTTIPNNDPKLNESFGHDIWWFGPKGWQPLFDADTRYEYTHHTLTEAVSVVPVATEQTKFPDVGMVKVDTTYNIYDGSRKLENNTNIVNEKGLKKHIDDLQSQINALVQRVTSLESELASVKATVNNHSSRITNNTNSINSLSGRVSALETA